MLKRCLAVVALAALPLGYGVSVGAVHRAPSPQPMADRAVPRAPAAPRTSPDEPVHIQMRGFDRHARVDMILYTGRFGPTDRASTQRVDPNAVALPRLAPLE